MILLIEDRAQRQFRALNLVGFSLAEYSDVLENAVPDRYDEIYQALKEDSFDFSQYSFIISHKSAFDNDNAAILQKLKAGCKKEGIPLVLFTGGIETSYHDSEDLYAEMRSNALYSENLKLFLESARADKPYMLILLYGLEWKLNIMLNTLEKVNLAIEKDDEDRIFYKRFVSETGIENLHVLDIKTYEPKREGKYTSKVEIKKCADALLEHVRSIIDA